MSPPEPEDIRARLLAWWEGSNRDFPWRQENTSPYEVLVAEVLLVRKRAEEVEPVYRTLVERYSDLKALSSADHEKLAQLLEPLGFQNRRADALLKIARQCREDGIPDDEATLLGLPFVGPYVAAATRCFAFGESTAIVDNNVARVYRRLLGVDEGPESDELWRIADELKPDRPREFNLALLDFGATICTPQDPDCFRCPLRESCQAYVDEDL